MAFRSKSYGNNSADTNPSFTATEPSGAVQDDILLFVTSFYINSASNITGPAGWTLLASRDDGTWGFKYRIWWIRRGASTPDLTVSWDGGYNAHGYEWGIAAYSNIVASGNPWTDSPTTATGTANPAAPDPPSITNTISAGTNVAFGIGQSGATSTWTAPSGFTLREAGSATWAISHADKDFSSSGAVDPGTFTGSATGNNAWDAVTVQLQPSGGGGGATSSTPSMKSSQLMQLIAF